MAKAPPKKKVSSKRTLIKPKGDAGYIRRDAKGRSKESDDVGRITGPGSEAESEDEMKSGQGNKGDQKRRPKAETK